MMRAFKLSAALLLTVFLLSGCYIYDRDHGGHHQPDGPQQQQQKGAY
jgi:hypothetical protein